jgi:hypothetical protein
MKPVKENIKVSQLRKSPKEIRANHHTGWQDGQSNVCLIADALVATVATTVHGMEMSQLAKAQPYCQ